MSQSSSAGASSPGPRILVVEDDPNVARTLLDLLALHRYAAARAESGEQALEMLAREAFDLVLLDIRMPGLDGFETCRRIRRDLGPYLPVIMLTALGDARSLREGYESGADDFLQKPVDTPALILKVRAFLRLKALHDETVRHREEAQGRARDLALLHEIGRDWSLIDRPEDFARMVTERLAGLIGAPICILALYDAARRTLSAALPAHGLPDETARRLRYVVKPEYRGLWNFSSGRPYVANQAPRDPRLIQQMVRIAGAESAVLVPMLSGGTFLGLIGALNKTGGFTDADVQLLTIFAGPAASFLRSRMIYDQQRRHSTRLERLNALLAEMGGTFSRAALLELTTDRLLSGFGYERVAFHATEGEGGLRLEREARGTAAIAALPPDPHLLAWAGRGAQPLQAEGAEGALVELAVPVRAGDEALGVLDVCKAAGEPFGEEEASLLQAAARQLAVALQRSASVARTERLAAQMAALYDVGLETAALRDLRGLFSRATQEAGRLIHADHTSVLRYDGEEACLHMFAAWGRDPAQETYASPRFRLGEGVAGRVARDRLAVLVNDPAREPDFLLRANPVARLICVPLTFHAQGGQEPALFGVLNATRRPGAPPFTEDDLSYLNRFANQLSIAVANSMAFQSERQRSEQLALVNTLLREIAGKLSRDRIVEAACRRIQEAFRHPLVAVEWPDAEAGHRRLAAVACSAPRLPAWGEPPLEAGIVGRAIRERCTVLVQDVSEAPEAAPLLGVTRSLAAVPVVSGEEVMAVLYLESEARHAFDRGQVITLETLADGLGIILRNADLYQALESNNARLVELDRMKSELVNIVAHDFRAPLAGVLGHAELLEWRPEGPVEERVTQARAIVDSATHMANLVDKTLKTTRLETGHFPFEFALVDLSVVLRRTVARVPESTTHPLTLELPEEPLPVWADQDRVAEVLDNLLSNAVKYSPEGGAVSVKVRREGDTVGVSVADHGVGIEEQHLGRLFRPFSRVRERRTASIEGSGLGLYICERVIKAHGGRLNVTSRPGEGSTFSFSMPLYGVAAQTRAPLVLVAAGDEPTRRAVRRVAEELGFAVQEAADGVEALEAALRLQPVVLVVERILPKLGAVEVARRLQLNPHTESVRLIALAEAEDLGEAAALFGACLARPFDPHRLASCLEALAATPGLPAASRE